MFVCRKWQPNFVAWGWCPWYWFWKEWIVVGGWVLLSKVVVVLWCCKGTLKIVVELPVFYWLQFAVWPQAQDSNSHIFGVRRTDQAVLRVDETMELVKALEPNLPTPVAFKEMHIELLWIWRIVFILFLCILMVVKCLHLLCLLVVLKRSWYHWKVLSQGMANSCKLCQKFVSASIQEVRSLNLSVYIIHYMNGILLTDPPWRFFYYKPLLFLYKL